MAHIRVLLVPAALAVAAACAAPAAEQKPAAHAPAAAPAPKAAATSAAKPQAGDDVMVCRYERETGSNIAQKVCRPKNQPSMTDDASREWMRQQQSNNVQSRPSGT